MNKCYWILRRLRAWLIAHSLTTLALIVCVAVLFGVDQVSHLVFHLPSIKALWASHFVLTFGFWTMVTGLVAAYVLLGAYVVPIPERGFLHWCDESMTRKSCFVLTLLLTVGAFVTWRFAPEDSLVETLAWAAGLGIPIFYGLGLFMHFVGEPILDVPWIVFEKLHHFWRRLEAATSRSVRQGAAGVVAASFVGLWFLPVETQAYKGFVGILIGFFLWTIAAILHSRYGDLERTQTLFSPIGRALWILVWTNLLGEMIWNLAKYDPETFSYRNYSIWCILHLLLSVVLIARVLDWWQTTSRLPIRIVGFVGGVTLLFFVSGTADVGNANDKATPPAEPTKVWLEQFHSRIVARPAGKPVIVVAASGGGSRAALFTALVFEALAREPLDPKNPKAGSLADQVVLISSVSGGSLGSAYYTVEYDKSERAELQNSLKDELKVWLPKKAAEFASKFDEESDDQAKKTYARWWKDTRAICDSINAGNAAPEFDWLLRSTFADEMCTDTMAPLLRGVLFPGKERGVSVTGFWEDRFKNFKHMSDEPWDARRPFLVLDTTEVESGRRLALGFPSLPPGFFARGKAMPEGSSDLPAAYYEFESFPLALADRDPKYRLSIGEGVRLSANFPFGFNPGRLNLSPPTEERPNSDLRNPRLLKVIDGGVLDNTGIDTLSALFLSLEACDKNEKDDRAIQKQARAVRDELRRRGIIVLEIDSGANPGKPGLLARLLGNIFDPLEGLNKAGFVNFQNSKRTYAESIQDGFLEEVALPGSVAPPYEFPLCRFVPYHCNHVEDVMTAWALGPGDKAAIFVQFIFEQQYKRAFLRKAVEQATRDVRELAEIRKMDDKVMIAAAMQEMQKEQKAYKELETAVAVVSAQTKATLQGPKLEADKAMPKPAAPLVIPTKKRITPNYGAPTQALPKMTAFEKIRELERPKK